MTDNTMKPTKPRKSSKSWHWDREDKIHEIFKKADMEGKPHPDIKRPNIPRVYTKLKWGREATGFNASIYVDGGETDMGFYFGIPWLFHLSVTASVEHEVFKRWFPKVYEKDATLGTGFNLSREYLSLYLFDFDTWDSSERKGFHKYIEWVELLKGKFKKTTVSEPIVMGSYTVPVTAKFTKDDPDSVRLDNVTFEVSEVTITHERTRWFPEYSRRYEVTNSTPLYYQGKGENSWDMDDREFGGGAGNSFSFPSDGLTPFDAVIKTVNEYYRMVERYGQ